VLAALVLAVTACPGEYSLSPTACDDYCRAVQRADCADDYPADCVRDCESDRASDACDGAWQALDECYADAAANAFVCVDDRSQPGRVCLPERRALSECLAPASGPCFDECVRQVDACGATLSDCEAGCHAPAPGCDGVAHDYYACLVTFPAECRSSSEPDPRRAEQVPCANEFVDLWTCAQ
jgi:hypothetical protein